ncbi:MAG: hypothetical protein BRC29_00600 [Nanohaloarchaea archaeon SW_7_43_1]|nr:MAG: hypothetical protein BRC29_00600 [Nanohaloarchaea archaeon SW_7_43_1]
MEPEQIVEKIVEETDLEEDEIEEKVDEKMDEFEGLVSEEGAIHLVAKEADVQIAESSDQALKVENIVPDMRKVNIKGRVTRISETNTFERDDGDDGKVRNITLGDGTGTARLSLWDDQTEIAEKVDEGDAIGISGAYTVEDNQGNAELRLGDSAQVKMMDDDEVPEVEADEVSEKTEASIREVRSKNAEYSVRGMIMDVYTSSPFYSQCPECGNTVREDDDGEYVCEEHGEVEPDKALAMSIVLDDGTGNTRVVMFGDRARELLDIDEETEKEGDIEAVEKAATDVIGRRIEVEGRARHNDYFGTLELIANSFEEIEAEKELDQIIEMFEA